MYPLRYSNQSIKRIRSILCIGCNAGIFRSYSCYPLNPLWFPTLNSSEGGIWTRDLLVMSQPSYQTALPHNKKSLRIQLLMTTLYRHYCFSCFPPHLREVCNQCWLLGQPLLKDLNYSPTTLRTLGDIAPNMKIWSKYPHSCEIWVHRTLGTK